MQFIGGDESKLLTVVRLVDIFPPPLMADDGDKQRIVTLLRLRNTGLNVPQRSRGDKHQEKYNERGSSRPRNFDRLAPVDLRRLAGLLLLRFTKSPHRIKQHPFDNNKD